MYTVSYIGRNKRLMRKKTCRERYKHKATVCCLAAAFRVFLKWLKTKVSGAGTLEARGFGACLRLGSTEAARQPPAPSSRLAQSPHFCHFPLLYCMHSYMPPCARRGVGRKLSAADPCDNKRWEGLAATLLVGPLHVCMYAVLTVYTSSTIDVEAGIVDHSISAVNMLRTVNLCGILYMYLGIPPARLVVTRAVPLLLLHLLACGSFFQHCSSRSGNLSFRS